MSLYLFYETRLARIALFASVFTTRSRINSLQSINISSTVNFFDQVTLVIKTKFYKNPYIVQIYRLHICELVPVRYIYL